MQLRNSIRSVCLSAAVAVVAIGCGDDDDAAAGNGRTFSLRIENIAPENDFSDSGGFAVPVGASDPGPIGPGGAYEIAFDAAPGDYLSFALMFVPSNDLFYGPDDRGVLLYPNGNQLTGDITDQIDLWDAGTEANEEAGLGPNQVQRQSGPNTGPDDPNPSVRLAEGANLPAVEDVLRASLESTSETGFILRLENVSTAGTLGTSDGATQAVPLSPGVFVIHLSGAQPLFTVGEADRGDGLEAIAEDGTIGPQSDALAARSGVMNILAPGVAVVHDDDGPIFDLGLPDRGQGLEALAEDGDPSGLASALPSVSGISDVAVFNTPAGAASPGPALPGDAYQVEFDASPGDRLSFATMFVESNDLFFGPDDLGVDLFDAAGNPVTGDITAQILLWDAGTEIDQVPGVGPDQALRQSDANVGADDPDDNVRLADDTSGRIPSEDQLIRVTLEAR